MFTHLCHFVFLHDRMPELDRRNIVNATIDMRALASTESVLVPHLAEQLQQQLDVAEARLQAAQVRSEVAAARALQLAIRLKVEGTSLRAALRRSERGSECGAQHGLEHGPERHKVVTAAAEEEMRAFGEAGWREAAIIKVEMVQRHASNSCAIPQPQFIGSVLSSFPNSDILINHFVS